MGKRRATPGTKQVNIELDEALHARFREYVRARGETMREAVERAIARDMGSPPPPPAAPPPLPPMPAETAGARPRKKAP